LADDDVRLMLAFRDGPLDADADAAKPELAADGPASDELVDARRAGLGLEAALAALPER
jgi:hypothetical protein